MIFRVSEAESFRQWRDNEEQEVTDLLSWLRDGATSERMEAGTAFHKALELSEPGDFDALEANGYRFEIDTNVQLALPSIREVRHSKSYGPITITGQVDAFEGLRIEDHKTTGRFDPDRYIGGYAWRYYLDIFEARVFRWNVFEIKEIDPKVYRVFAHHTLEQYRYPNMTKDCETLALELAEFAAQHMPERLQAIAA